MSKRSRYEGIAAPPPPSWANSSNWLITVTPHAIGPVSFVSK